MQKYILNSVVQRIHTEKRLSLIHCILLGIKKWRLKVISKPKWFVWHPQQSSSQNSRVSCVRILPPSCLAASPCWPNEFITRWASPFPSLWPFILPGLLIWFVTTLATTFCFPPPTADHKVTSIQFTFIHPFRPQLAQFKQINSVFGFKLRASHNLHLIY